MCDQDHFEKDRQEFEAQGLVTRRQFGIMHNIYNAPEAQLLGTEVSYKDTVTMGHVARAKLGEKMYSIMGS